MTGERRWRARRVSKAWKLALLAVPMLGTTAPAEAPAVGASVAPSYAVVVSAATRGDPGWGGVVEALRARHRAEVHVWRERPDATLGALRRQRPRHTAFVAAPAEATRALVVTAHRMCRALDEDPWGGCCWGIVTGIDASNALAIVETPSPLIIRRALGGPPSRWTAWKRASGTTRGGRAAPSAAAAGRRPRRSRCPSIRLVGWWSI